MRKYPYLLIVLIAAAHLGCSQGVPQKHSPLVIQTNVISIESGSYRINIRYPYTNNTNVDRAVSWVIRDASSRFKKDSAGPKANPDWRYELWMDYKASQYSRDIICFKFEVYQFTGGAHGNTGIITRVVDINTGKEFKFNDIFRDSAYAAEKISEMALPILKRKLGNSTNDKWLREGAGPKQENFQKLIFTTKEMVFYFEQYRVAPYSEGIQEVKIALSKLLPLLKPPFNVK